MLVTLHLEALPLKQRKEEAERGLLFSDAAARPSAACVEAHAGARTCRSVTMGCSSKSQVRASLTAGSSQVFPFMPSPLPIPLLLSIPGRMLCSPHPLSHRQAGQGLCNCPVSDVLPWCHGINEIAIRRPQASPAVLSSLGRGMKIASDQGTFRPGSHILCLAVGDIRR